MCDHSYVDHCQFSFYRRVLFLPETEETSPRQLGGVLRVPHDHRPAAPGAARLVQSPHVHDPLAVVLHGDQRGVQSVAGQLHDGAGARGRVHTHGPDTGLETGDGGQPAVAADHERDDGHHEDIAHVHEAAAAVATHQLRARHRPAGGQTGHSPVRGQTVHVLLFHTAGPAHQGQDTHTLLARVPVAHAHHPIHVQRRLVPDRVRERRAQHTVRDRHRRPLAHASGLQQGAAAGEDPRSGVEVGPAQGSVPVPVLQLRGRVPRVRRRDLLVQTISPSAAVERLQHRHRNER